MTQKAELKPFNASRKLPKPNVKRTTALNLAISGIHPLQTFVDRSDETSAKVSGSAKDG